LESQVESLAEKSLESLAPEEHKERRITDQESISPYLAWYNGLILALASSLVFLTIGSPHPNNHFITQCCESNLSKLSDHDSVFRKPSVMPLAWHSRPFMTFLSLFLTL
jgi:hypothetical protein